MSPENRELLEVGGGVKNPETASVFHIPRAVLEELFDAARAKERARAVEVVRTIRTNLLDEDHSRGWALSFTRINTACLAYITDSEGGA